MTLNNTLNMWIKPAKVSNVVFNLLYGDCEDESYLLILGFHIWSPFKSRKITYSLWFDRLSCYFNCFYENTCKGVLLSLCFKTEEYSSWMTNLTLLV